MIRTTSDVHSLYLSGFSRRLSLTSGRTGCESLHLMFLVTHIRLGWRWQRVQNTKDTSLVEADEMNSTSMWRWSELGCKWQWFGQLCNLYPTEYVGGIREKFLSHRQSVAIATCSRQSIVIRNVKMQSPDDQVVTWQDQEHAKQGSFTKEPLP